MPPTEMDLRGSHSKGVKWKGLESNSVNQVESATFQ